MLNVLSWCLNETRRDVRANGESGIAPKGGHGDPPVEGFPGRRPGAPPRPYRAPKER